MQRRGCKQTVTDDRFRIVQNNSSCSEYERDAFGCQLEPGQFVPSPDLTKGTICPYLRQMSKSPLDWMLIDRAAEAIGVSRESRKKWRQRNHVPYRWRLPLITQTNGLLSVNDFVNHDKKRKKQ
jgi:hypothetical protein